MLKKIFGHFYSRKSFKTKLLNKIIALSLVLFQAVFLLILLDSKIFKVSAQISVSTDTVNQAQTNSSLPEKLAKPINFSETKKQNSEETVPQPTEIETGNENDNLVIADECINIGINDFNECSHFLGLNSLCQQKNIKTAYLCDIYLNLNIRCKELNLNESECQAFLNLPLKCQNANIKTESDCQKFLYNESLPFICTKNNIANHEDCNEFLAVSNFPTACTERGIKTKNSCHNYLTDKTLETECLDAEITSAENCEKFLLLQEQKNKCNFLGIDTDEQCTFYFNNKSIDQECLNSNINNQTDCNKYLANKYTSSLCKMAGIEKNKECQNYIFNKYQPTINCGIFDNWQCQEIIEAKFINEIASKQIKFEELTNFFNNNQNKTTTIENFKSGLSTAKILLPLADKNTNVGIVQMENKTLLAEINSLIQTAPLAIIIDSDTDGLPDDTENRIGTDPTNPDSDNDGYSDSEELKKNFNPLGDGIFNKEVAPIDKAIIAGAILEQPKISGVVYPELAINKFINSDKNDFYTLSGKAEPNTIVTLYIYSDMPLLVTARTDEFGNWQYDLKESLIDGEHEIYVALNDNTGKITKRSNPINFFIKEAKAVSIQDFVAGAPKNAPTKTESMLNFYLIISLAIAGSGILLFIIFIILHKNKKEINDEI